MWPAWLLYSSSLTVVQSARGSVIGWCLSTYVTAIGCCGPCPVEISPVNCIQGVARFWFQPSVR